MARSSTVTVYEVLYLDETREGPAGDGTFIKRFSAKRDADAFAKGKSYFNDAAEVSIREVPRKLAQRWGLA